MQYAFNPKFYSDKAFNLGGNSQDLAIGIQLYQYAQAHLANLETVFLGISTFTKGYQLSKTKRSFICDALHYLYGFEFADYNFCSVNIRNLKQLDKVKNTGKIYKGYSFPLAIDPLAEEVKERCIAHLRENIRKASQLYILENLAQQVKQDGKVLCLGIMPVTNAYKANMPSAQTLFHELYEMAAKKNIKLIDLYQSDIFSDEHFYDNDHLNELGSEKFTKIIKAEY